MKFLARFTTLAAALVLTSCATTQAKWLTDLNAVYPEARFLAATGAGDTRADAEASAAASLSRRFEVKVDATTVSRQNSTSTSAGGKVSTVAVSEFDQTVGLTGAQDFLNLQFSDPVTDKQGVVHVVAFLEKGPTARLYSERINEDLERIRALTARSAAATGAMASYALADAAVGVAAEAGGRSCGFCSQPPLPASKSR